MSRTTRDLWLEDRRGVLDRSLDQTWWGCLRWVVAVGLVCATASWGWPFPLVAVVVVAGLVVLGRSLAAHPRPARPGQVTDSAVVAGLATVGASGLVASAGGWALLPLLLLTGTSPWARRTGRNAGAILRWSLTQAREMRPGGPRSSSDDHGWP